MSGNRIAKPEGMPLPSVEPVASAALPSNGSDDSKVSVPKVSGGIKVKALRAGFYKHSRKSLGDIFEVPSEKHIGSWMERIDKKTGK